MDFSGLFCLLGELFEEEKIEGGFILVGGEVAPSQSMDSFMPLWAHSWLASGKRFGLVSIHAGHGSDLEIGTYTPARNMIIYVFLFYTEYIVINRQQLRRWHHSGFVALGRSLAKRNADREARRSFVNYAE